MITQQLGREGESIARRFLENKGFKIITTNWRHGHLEIDIIAEIDKVLHIVEVKTLRHTSAGYPEESVTRAKFLNLQRAAEAFMAKYPRWEQLQFDVVSITMDSRGRPSILFIEDVYF